ncbi:hypothetical protein GCM10022419_081120 [Nonomuraea rosea]|uniref:Pentapeptide repeat-containing protein n=1 Tax=Nonomuraea rosea TaxID=638574 RepID=A0ABP6YMI8_9ACTN
MPAPSGKAGDREGELRVRLTAQRILAAHVRDDRPAGQHLMPPAFWEGMSLDLTGAALVDFDLTDGRVAAAGFERARFPGAATFDEATFGGLAAFAQSTFSSHLSFDRTAFSSIAGFHECVLTDRAARHVLPPGRRLGTTSEVSARLVYHEKSGD